MTLLPAFVGHELRTQFRSPRFAGVAAAYTLLCSMPALAIALAAARGATYVVGGGMYSMMIDATQPLLTAIAATALAVDAISRERDEGSLGVVSLAPLSAAGYVLRRWFALLVILLPLTFLPRMIGYAIAAASVDVLPSPEPFFVGWLVYAFPVAIIISALALALGTITGRTVLALVATFFIFTFGIELMNDVLAYRHLHFEGIGTLIRAEGPGRIEQLTWILRGWGGGFIPSEAGFDRSAEIDAAISRAAMPFAIAMPLLGIASMYVRRSRPDLRPWRIPEKHQLRSFLRTLNRLRDEYAPDATREWPDRLAILLGLAIAIATGVWLVRRHEAFFQLATDRYEGELENAPTTPLTVVPVRAAVRGEIRADGTVATVADLDLRNNGATPVSRLVFAINEGLQVSLNESPSPRVRGEGARRADEGSPFKPLTRPSATLSPLTRGEGLSLRKAWERIEVDLHPPLAAAETRRLSFTMRGIPGEIDFELYGSGHFDQIFRRYLRATKSIELPDLSRSRLLPYVSRARFALSATDLMPVPRYSPWKHDSEEVVAPEIPLEVDLAVPPGLRAVDSCGSIAASRVRSKCRVALTDYLLHGARLDTRPLDASATLLYLPAHRELAQTHAPALAGGVALARQAWPRVPLPDRLIFYERPTASGEKRYWGYEQEERLRSSGRLIVVPELVFINTQAIDRSRIASSLLIMALRRQRRVAAEEEAFFNGLYSVLARMRVGGRKPNAVIPPTGGGAPQIDPLLPHAGRDRLSRVMADLEYRVGSDRLFQAVEDFVFAGDRPGTARELLDAIERRSGMDLDRTYSDYFTGNALPVLTLKDVHFIRAGRQWEVRGTLRNERTGEAFCPLVLRTAGGPLRQTIRIGSGQSVPFTFLSDHEPRTLQLDPERVCYRYAQIGTIDSIDFRGEG